MLELIYFILALLIAITIHECAHAWVANFLGDPTAKYEGRISLNPLKHLDLWGTVMFILFKFGWGKPVPINPRNFRNPLRDSAFVSLAGPLSNLFLALILSLPIKYLYGYANLQWLINFLQILFLYNLVLAIFNFFPFPPLDGSKILGLFVPKRLLPWYAAYLENGMFYFMLFILFDSFFLVKMTGFSLVGFTVFSVLDFVTSLIFLGT